MDPAHGVPMKIWLYPLPGGEVLYRSLSDSAAGKVTDTLEQFEALAGHLRVLRERKAIQALPTMANAVKQLQAHFTEFLRVFKIEIKNLHSEIKRKNGEEAVLLDVLRKLRELPFASENIRHWIEGRKEEADILDVVSEHSKPVKPSDTICRVALVMRAYCEDPDGYSQLLDAAVRKYHEEGLHILNLHTKMSADARSALRCKFDDKHKTMITEFDHCHQNHKNKKGIYFELVEQSIEKTYHNETVYFEIHDRASHHIRFTGEDLLPDGVSSVKVSPNTNTSHHRVSITPIRRRTSLRKAPDVTNKY